jgi:hypothetical protein
MTHQLPKCINCLKATADQRCRCYECNKQYCEACSITRLAFFSHDNVLRDRKYKKTINPAYLRWLPPIDATFCDLCMLMLTHKRFKHNKAIMEFASPPSLTCVCSTCHGPISVPAYSCARCSKTYCMSCSCTELSCYAPCALSCHRRMHPSNFAWLPSHHDDEFCPDCLNVYKELEYQHNMALPYQPARKRIRVLN